MEMNLEFSQAEIEKIVEAEIWRKIGHGDLSKLRIDSIHPYYGSYKIRLTDKPKELPTIEPVAVRPVIEAQEIEQPF